MTVASNFYQEAWKRAKCQSLTVEYVHTVQMMEELYSKLLYHFILFTVIRKIKLIVQKGTLGNDHRSIDRFISPPKRMSHEDGLE